MVGVVLRQLAFQITRRLAVWLLTCRASVGTVTLRSSFWGLGAGEGK